MGDEIEVVKHKTVKDYNIDELAWTLALSIQKDVEKQV